MTEVARKRLQVIAELTELGSGFKIAMRDLEIRGAGNLLGAEQSGHIAAVGFDLYTPAHPGDRPRAEGRACRGRGGSDHPPPGRGVHSGVLRPRSRAAPEPVQAAGRPPGGAALTDFAEELVDRFGPMPVEAEWLLQMVDLKIQARQAPDPGDRRPPGSDPGALRLGPTGEPGDDRHAACARNAAASSICRRISWSTGPTGRRRRRAWRRPENSCIGSLRVLRSPLDSMASRRVRPACGRCPGGVPFQIKER